MLSNNKFLGKCWYGRHPWIRLAMESKSMVDKGINFNFCLGTAYDISSMESIGKYSIIFVDRKSMPPKIPSSLSEGPFFYFMNFLFESPSSLIKHQLGNTIIILVHPKSINHFCHMSPLYQHICGILLSF